MKKRITFNSFRSLKVLSLALALFFMITSCEEENLTSENESTAEIESVESMANNGWQTIFFDGFNSFNNNNWTKTHGRNDYNSNLTEYVRWLVNTGNKDGRTALRLEGKKSGANYRSGHVKSKRQFTPQNGEEIRITYVAKMDVQRWDNTWHPLWDSYGAWPALWSTNEEVWPRKGEIDCMEAYSRYDVHYASNLFYGRNALQNELGSSAEREWNVGPGWHTYDIYWKRNSGGWTSVNIFVDNQWKAGYNNNNTGNGKLRLQDFKDHNLIMNMNIGDNFGIFDNSRINVKKSVNLWVDYVRVQKRNL